jgi:very-short-patch-repair endonuclease
MDDTSATLSAARGPTRSPPRRSPARWADVERRVLELATRQHGVVTRAQLLELGASRDAVDRRITAGWLGPIHRGVYRVGPAVAPLSRAMGAALACGEGAVVSHGSAATQWKMLPRRGQAGFVDIGLPAGFRRRSGIRVHRLRTLRPDETTVLDGIPITTPPRTLCDSAGALPPRDLERAVAEALALRLTTRSRILEVLGRHPGLHGARRLKEILSADTPPARTRSTAEEVFFLLVRKSRLPAPKVNTVVAGYEVDFYWPVERLVVEIDGYTYHSSKRKFELDHRRDADLSGAGETVMRITWDQLRDEPEAVLACLVRALERRGARG